jgi:hypothetical protein
VIYPWRLTPSFPAFLPCRCESGAQRSSWSCALLEALNPASCCTRGAASFLHKSASILACRGAAASVLPSFPFNQPAPYRWSEPVPVFSASTPHKQATFGAGSAATTPSASLYHCLIAPFRAAYPLRQLPSLTPLVDREILFPFFCLPGLTISRSSHPVVLGALALRLACLHVRAAPHSVCSQRYPATEGFPDYRIIIVRPEHVHEGGPWLQRGYHHGVAQLLDQEEQLERSQSQFASACPTLRSLTTCTATEQRSVMSP